MSIAFDTSSSGSTINSAHTSQTFAHTCSGTDRVLIVNVGTFNSTGGNIVTGVTYNGVALTRLAEVFAQANTASSLWYLIAPATGTNNIVVSFSSQTFSWVTAVSYTGVNQSSFPNATSNGTGSSAVISGTVVSTVDNCWAIMTQFCNAAGQTAGASTTLRVTSPTDGRSGISDSNGVISPAGSRTLTVNCTSNTWAQIIVAIAPAGGTPTPRRLMLMGVGS